MQTVASWDLGRNSAGYQGPICSSSTHSVRTNCCQTCLAGRLTAAKMTSRNVGWVGRASISAWLPLSQDQPAEHFNLAQFVSRHQRAETRELVLLIYCFISSLANSYDNHFSSSSPLYLHIYRQGCSGTIKLIQSDLSFVRAHQVILPSPSHEKSIDKHKHYSI